jgi:acetyl esterase
VALRQGFALMFAEGMEAAIRRHEGFASDDEAAAFWAEGAPAVPVSDHVYPGGSGQPQAVRLYRGGASSPSPVLLYVHGGGWQGGSIALNEAACRALAADSGWTVASISYRLAPAHPYPAAEQDCAAALRWLREQATALEIDAGRIAVGGTSAGANLAMALALTRLQPSLAGLVLFYGVFGADFETGSYRTFAEGFGLTRARMQTMFELYDPAGRRDRDPLVTPLLGDLAGLPPAAVIAAELDVLRDDSLAMAAAMRAAGVPVLLHVEPGVTHGFINRARMVPAAAASLARAAGFLKDRLGPASAGPEAAP